MNLPLHFSPQNLIYFLIWCGVLVYASHLARVFREKQINLISKWPWFFLFSGFLLTLGIISLVLPAKGLKLGLDFKGGTLLEIGFSKKVTTQQVRNTIAPIAPVLKHALIQLLSKPPEIGEKNPPVSIILIRSQRLGKTEKQTQKMIKTILTTLKSQYGAVTLRQSKTIGPTIGHELLHDAVIAIIAALIFQLIYITLRFGWNLRYGISADLALIHDVLMMVGLYALFGKEANSPFLAALLTVIGYSVMDSIVIFYRIRENLTLITRASFESVVNQSVLQTMTRSINTLMTVLITLFALYFFGGETLRNFAFALLIGVTSGGYSSIFIASPILVLWERWSSKREKQKMLSTDSIQTNGKKQPAAVEPITDTENEAGEVPLPKRVPKRKPGRRRS
jgi:preprotein translocase subunit SecF